MILYNDKICLKTLFQTFEIGNFYCDLTYLNFLFNNLL